MKNRAARVDISKLGEPEKTQLEMIRDDTNNFADQDVINIYQDNFDRLIAIIEKKYPEAVKKAAPVKKVKPAQKKTVKAKVTAKASAKKKPAAAPPAPKGNIEECKKILADADYSITKKFEKGKRKVTRKKRQDRTILKDKAEDAVKTISKDIKPTAARADKWKKELDEFAELLRKLLQKIDNLVNEDRDMVKLQKIKALLKELLD